MAQKRKVFVIRGSEDGNMEVVSNMSKAYDSCFKYTSFNGEYFKVAESKGNFMNRLSKHGYATLTSDNCTATAEKFYLN